MLTVCAPGPVFLPDSRHLAEGWAAVIWDGRGDVPAAAVHTRFLVAGYAGRVFDRSALAALPELEVVQLISAGYEDWLDWLPAGVTLANGRGVHGSSTAELAVAGVLALVRDLPFYSRQQAQHRWAPERHGEISGRRALILGSGDIGTRVAQAFDGLGALTTSVGRTPRAGIHAIAEPPRTASGRGDRRRRVAAYAPDRSPHRRPLPDGAPRWRDPRERCSREDHRYRRAGIPPAPGTDLSLPRRDRSRAATG